MTAVREIAFGSFLYRLRYSTRHHSGPVACCRYECEFPPSSRGTSIFGRAAVAAEPSRRCAERRRRPGAAAGVAADDGGGRTAALYVLAALACVSGAAATLTGGVLVCRYAHLCQRVKGLRYRWQIRYREVSNTETAGSGADAKT